jgi:hypothetical protein
VGKTLSPSGRAVNRKGAFLCTDGARTALAFMRGLGKIPTSFSMDVVVQDEKDDLPEEHARFLAGRMTASNLRLTLLIGTQRYHGAGQNLAFTEGTQHIGLLSCPSCDARHNPETLWPGICRLEMPELTAQEWPKLTVEGHFAFGSRRTLGGGQSAEQKAPPLGTAAATLPIPFTPGQNYVLACPDCGAALDREHPHWHALAPEREAQRRWSYRLSQLLIPAIDLTQIVAAWQLAIRDPEHMTVFCTDRLALPKSTTQSLTPHDLQAARGDYNLELRTKNLERGADSNAARSSFSVLSSAFLRFGGLDMGDQCWFVARAVDAAPPHLARRLNPRAFYLAMRWDYAHFPKEFLRNSVVKLINPANALHVFARPVDFGPGDGTIIDGQPTPDTGRIADLSPGVATALGLQTDDAVRCELVG